MKKQSELVKSAINDILNKVFRENAEREGMDRYFDKDYASLIPELGLFEIQVAIVALAKELTAESKYYKKIEDDK
jgi:hypothetical protein